MFKSTLQPGDAQTSGSATNFMGPRLTKPLSSLPGYYGGYEFPEEAELRAHFKKTVPQEWMWNDGIVEAVIKLCSGQSIQGNIIAREINSHWPMGGANCVNADCACKIIEDAIEVFLIDCKL